MSVTAAEGFVASGMHAGIKRRKFDMAMIATEDLRPVPCAAVFSYLRGTFKGRESDGSVVIEVGGIGYSVIVPPIVDGEISATCAPDSELLLYVSPQSARDQPWPVLFGFLNQHQKAFWELLISVPRVGGKLAARAMVAPIDQIGWRSAASGVARAMSSRLAVRNGPPEAVGTIFSTAP